jgi:hypothetical protein
MRLYVANPTAQKQLICYRVDHDNNGNLKDTNRRFSGASQQEIGPGLQAQLGSDMHENQVADVIEQLARYGMVDVSDVSSLPARKVPYICSKGKPVPASVMERVKFHNENVLTSAGAERRKAAAVASNAIVQNTVHNQFAAERIPAEPADTTIVTIEQLEQSEAGEKRIEEGYEITPEGKRGPRSGKMAAKRRK